MSTNDILQNGFNAMAEVSDRIVPGSGEHYRRVADQYSAPSDLMCRTCQGKGQYAGLDITCRACHGSGLEPIDEAVLKQAMRDAEHLDD